MFGKLAEAGCLGKLLAEMLCAFLYGSVWRYDTGFYPKSERGSHDDTRPPFT
jgi:hypothetical protein